MKTVVPCIASAVMLMSCHYHYLQPDSETFILFPNSEIDTFYIMLDVDVTDTATNLEPVISYSIDEGSKIVAQYTFAAYEDPMVADDEYGYKLTFEIDPDVNEFFYQDEDLISVDCNFNEWGAWVSGIKYQVKEGFLSGKKNGDGTWSVIWDVTSTPIFSYDEPMHISGAGTFRFLED